MKMNLVKAAAMIGLAGSLSVPAWGIITNGTVEMNETGQLDGISFNVDFGSVEVSDLSGGGLRFNRGNTGIGGSQITTENLEITSLSELSFDWTVEDNSWYRDRAFYQIDNLDLEAIMLHDGIGSGSATGLVNRLLEPGDYNLIVSTFYNFEEGDFDLGTYDFMLRNLRITTLETDSLYSRLEDQSGPIREVPDSSLGFLGVASILGMIGSHRRFRLRKS